MRFKLYLIAIFLSPSLWAQQEFSGGLIAGPVSSQISGDGLGGWDKFGACIGGWVRLPLGEKTGLILQMSYINKGSLRVDTLTRTSFGFALDYIEAPILIDRSLGLLNKRLSAQLGPSVGFNIRQKIKANGEFYDPNPTFNALDIGIIGGLSFHPTAKYEIVFRTSTSVLPVRPAPTVPIPNSYYLKGNYNQTLQLLFSLRF